MSLSTDRLRRPNAGSKMSELLDSEEAVVDHFYDGVYGGFQEDEIDGDYTSGDTDSEDSIDSDFSIDEKDEPISDDQNEQQLKRKIKNKIKFGFNRNFSKSKQIRKRIKSKTEFETRNESKMRVPFELDIPSIKKRIISTNLSQSVFNEKSSEDSKTETKAKNCDNGLTQNELLEESVITEKINLKSLKEYEKLMAEKSKKSKVDRHSIKGPFIRYHSVSMPLIEELDDNRTEEMPIDESRESGPKSRTHSRTFVTFSDEQTYDSLFSSLSDISPAVPKAMVCPVTKLPARYFDPISQMPFANIEAFNAIRSQYYKQLENYENCNQTEVKKWIEWKHQFGDEWKRWQQKYLTYNMPQMPIDSESQTNKNELNPKVIHSSRKQKK